MRGQEALRVSLAGQDAAEARQRAVNEQKFQVKLGPVSLRVSASAGVEVTDNVRAVENNPQADLILRPRLDTFAVWRVTEKNSLTFGLGIGYLKYLHATDYDKFFISPGSDLSFDVYVKDFAINLHDRFAYTSDTTSDPTVSGRGSLTRIENTLGVGVTWDLNEMVINAGYDHDILNTVNTIDRYLDRSSELFTGGVGFKINPLVLAGLELGGGMTDFNEDLQPDNSHISIGPYVKAELTEYTSLRASGGYVKYLIDTSGLTNVVSEKPAFYFSIALNQRLSQMLTHGLSAGRRLQGGIESNLMDMWYANYSASWLLLHQTTVGTTLSFEHVTEPNLQQTETLNRYGFGLSFSRPITRKAVASLSYQIYYKDSDIANRGYLQNRLVFELGYTF